MPFRLAVLVTFLLADVLPAAAAPSQVTVSGHQLIVRKRLGDGSLAPAAPYVIRGVVWSPASDTTDTSPSDPNNAAVRRQEFATWKNTDIPLLAAMNVNTVRMLIDPGADANGTALLDQLYANGIMVIMTVDNGVNDTARANQIVSYYKDHPAILAWVLGNEWNINYYYGAATSVQAAAQRTQTAAALIKSIDTQHPVVSSYGEIDINDSGRHLADTQYYVNDICTSCDVWSLNIYRGNSFGNLFTQWASITAKPMFIGEFGTDVFRSAGSTSAGSVDETMQADWDIPLWDEIFGNLSANVPEAVALGGTLFEFNDEWWKVSPAGSQQAGGYQGAQPDGFANEEYFGLVDIHRNVRQAYGAVTTAFAPAYQPPATHSYRVISRGAAATEYPSEYGTTWDFLDGAKIYSTIGGGGGGRGFNIAVIDPATGALQQAVQHFDSYATRNTGDALCAIDTFIDSVPNGMLLLMGVADEGGLNQFPPSGCQFLNNSCMTPFLQHLSALGSQQIASYCYWDSWAFAAVKGEGVARAEGRGNGVEAAARTTLALPTRQLSLTFTGSGSVRSVPAGVNCNAACNVALRLGASFTLYPVAANGWLFSHWSGDCSGASCGVTMSQTRSVQAVFVVARTLSMQVTGSGTITTSPASVQCTSSCTTTWSDGEAVTLNATPASGWTFDSWSGDCSGTSCSVTMSADRSTTAKFIFIPSAPASLDAHYSGSAATISWPSVSGAASYEVERSDDNQAFGLIASPSMPSATDASAVAGHAYLYRVRAKSADGSASAWSPIDLMTAMTFSDDPLVVPSTKVRAVHVTELRNAINAVRALAGLGASTFIDNSLAGVRIKAQHITEMRSALDAARSSLLLPSLTYSRTLQSGVTKVGAIDVAELRSGVR
jgi:hypothetical protein